MKIAPHVLANVGRWTQAEAEIWRKLIAKRIVAHFGLETLDVIENQIERLVFVWGGMWVLELLGEHLANIALGKADHIKVRPGISAMRLGKGLSRGVVKTDSLVVHERLGSGMVTECRYTISSQPGANSNSCENSL